MIPTLAFVIGAFSFSSAQDGEQLFKQNCGSCHYIGKGKLVGPDLKNVHTKHNEGWLLSWIKGSQKMVKDGDSAAVQIYNEFKVPMPDAFINEAEIKSVLGYIKTKSEQPEVIAVNPVPVSSNKSANENMPMINFSFTEYVLAFLVVVLLIVIWTLSKAIKTLSKELSRYYDNNY